MSGGVPEGGVGELEDVAGPHQVEPRLVLVHRVQDRLGIEVKGWILSILGPHKVGEEILENAQLLRSRIALERQRQTS